MRQKSQTRRSAADKTIKDIRRATRKQYSAEEKIRIVLDGFLSIHAAVYNAFYVQRHLLSRGIFKEFRAETFAVWKRSCIAV